MFLAEAGRLAEAERHTLRLASQLDGNDYTGLLWLAEAMEAGGSFLCASILYRALMEWRRVGE